MWRHEIHSSASRLFVSSILTICVVALVLGACNIYPTPTPTVTPASTPTPTPAPTPTPTPAPTLTQQEAITIVQYWLRERTYETTSPFRTGDFSLRGTTVRVPCPPMSDRTWTATYDPAVMAWQIEALAKEEGYGKYAYTLFDRTRLVFPKQLPC
jgi:hypothetical protein